MNNKSNSSATGWVIAGIIGLILLISLASSNENNNKDISNTKTATSTYSTPIYKNTYNTDTPKKTTPSTSTAPDTWHCVDATSYNKNAYDDNKCTKGSEVRYVSDSQAVALDPSYTPGRSGHSYYNSR